MHETNFHHLQQKTGLTVHFENFFLNFKNNKYIIFTLLQEKTAHNSKLM